MTMTKKETFEKIENLKAALSSASEEIDEIVLALSKSFWHDGKKEEPQGEGVECLVMTGVDGENKACWDVLKWDNNEKAFVWWNEEFNQNCFYPADNFMLWADLNDLIDTKRLNENLAIDNSKDGDDGYRFWKSE